MKTLRSFLAITAIAFALTGCASLDKIVNANSFIGTAVAGVADAEVTPEAVIIASNTFDAVQITATNYLRLKRCTGTNGPLCRDPSYTRTIIATVKSGRQARNDLQQFVRDNPGRLGRAGLYNALTQSIATLRDMMGAYTASGAN